MTFVKALILTDPRSNALELIEDQLSLDGNVPGRKLNDGIHGQSLVGTVLLQCGISSGMAYTDDFKSKVDAKGMVIATHLLAWDINLGKRLLEFVSKGGASSY